MIELRGLHLGNIARSPAESARPDLWPDHAWVPALGCTGRVLYDLCGRQDAGAVAQLGLEWLSSGYAGVACNSVERCPALGDFRFAQDSAGTVLVVMERTAETMANSVSFGAWPLWGENPVLFLGLDAAFKPFLYVRGGADGTTNSLIGNAEVGVGEFRLACSFSMSYGGLYLGGELVAEIFGALEGIGLTSAQYYIGLKNDGYVVQKSICSLAIAHRRQLRQYQIVDLTADPLLPFRRRQPVFYSVPSGGGSIETPAAMMMAL